MFQRHRQRIDIARPRLASATAKLENIREDFSRDRPVHDLTDTTG
jgi:hypothetical protein